MKNPSIRCKCPECKATRLVSIADFLAGNNRCGRYVHGLKSPAPCPGKLDYFSDDYNDTLLNCAGVIQYLRNIRFEQPGLGELVDTLADDIGPWLEGNLSPQEMGWVDSKGRP